MKQVVRVFTNPLNFENMGMVLLSDQECTSQVNKSNVWALYNEEKLIGYNIMDEAFGWMKAGYQPLSVELLKVVNKSLLSAGFEALEADFEDYIVVGEVVECVNHPDSDHLHVCQVDVGSEKLQIVCGASNCTNHIKVVVAKHNAVLPDGHLIQSGSLRGIKSEGMLCSEWELRLLTEPKRGILILDDSASVGTAFKGGNQNV